MKMAEYIIKAEPETIIATANQMEGKMAVMEGCMNDMQMKINDLQNYFKSDAGNEFISKYAGVNNDIKACIKNLGNEITALKNAANALAEGSAKAKTDVSGLSGGNTFVNQG